MPGVWRGVMPSSVSWNDPAGTVRYRYGPDRPCLSMCLRRPSAPSTTRTSQGQEWIADITGAPAPIMLVNGSNSSSTNLCIGVHWGAELMTVAYDGAPAWKCDTSFKTFTVGKNAST